MGRSRVHKDADHDVDHDEKASSAEKGFDEAHVAHLFSGTLMLAFVERGSAASWGTSGSYGIR
jgi:hypothetical protein